MFSQLSTYLLLMAQKGTQMNKYGLLAQAHWRSHAPARYAALENPAAFFETVGETAAAQIEELSQQLEQDVPSDLEYLERVAQLRAVQKQAEEVVLGDLVYSVEPETGDLVEELDQILDRLPSPEMIENALQRMLEQAQEEAEREGWSQPLFSEEEEIERERLTALLPLVRLEQDSSQMPEPELRARILALAPFLPATQSDTLE